MRSRASQNGRCACSGQCAAAPAARHQLERPLVDAVRRRDVVQPQQQGQRIAVDAVVEIRMAPQRLQFGAEHQRVAGPAVVQRLLADAVARQPQAALAAVPQRQSEHAVAAAQAFLHAPGGERRQQHLGVGVAAEARTRRFESRAQLGEVVDLAVVGEHVAAIHRGHRLVPQRRQVEDAQALVRQRDARGRVRPDAAVVRPAVLQCPAHRAGQRRQFLFLPRRRRQQQARQSAHVPVPRPKRRLIPHPPIDSVTGRARI
jgi:hypothetical protein